MPNITISGLPLATLPLDGPNSFFEVQTIEAGVEVSRKVASDDLTLAAAIIIEDEGVPLAGGATTLDFIGAGVTASGAGSTKTIEILGGGQVDSVVSGVNITIDPADPINPIANLNAAITGVSVNGVTLSNAGVATDFLNEEGNYVAVGGGLADGTVDGAMLAWDVGNVAWEERVDLTYDDTALRLFLQNDATQVSMGVGNLSGAGSGAFLGFDFRTNFNPRILMNEPTGSGAEITVDSQMHFFSAASIIFRIHAGPISTSAALALDHTGTVARIFTGPAQGDIEMFANNGTQDIRFAFDTGLKIQEKAAAHANVLTYGQFWVRDTNDGEPMFTDDQGVDSVLNAAGALPDPLVIPSLNATSTESTSQTVSPYANVALNIGPNLTGTMGMMQINSQFIQTRQSAFGFNATLFINTAGAGTAGSNVLIGGLNGAQVEVDFGVAVRFQHAQSGTTVAETAAASAGGFLANNLATGAGLERVLTTADLGGAPSSLQATMGVGATTTIDLQIITGAALLLFDAADVDSVTIDIETVTMAPAEALVFDTTANIEVFSFDKSINIDGGDLNIGGPTSGIEFFRFGAGVSHSIKRDADGLHMQVVAGRFRLTADSIQQGEVAAPATNVAGQGQWWVRSSAPNRPTFTDDTDVDQLLDPSISEIVSVVASRTLVLEDKGKTIGFTGGTVAQTMTIPASGSVAYQIGTVIAFDNSGSVSFTIAITTDTLIFADNNGTGSRVLAAGGYAAAQKVGATTWKISGANIS
jgi:hypothetical protein